MFFVFTRDAAGNLWTGTWGNGISIIGKDGRFVRQYRHSDSDSNSLGGNNVYSIKDDGEGTIWVAYLWRGPEPVQYKDRRVSSL